MHGPSRTSCTNGKARDKLRLFFFGLVCPAGSFSAASNVTGILEDVDRVTAVLHRGGALAFWDYATAAPYVRVNMNPTEHRGDEQVCFVVPCFFRQVLYVSGWFTPFVLRAIRRNLPLC